LLELSFVVHQWYQVCVFSCTTHDYPYKEPEYVY
jgi:hypothetical protein